MGEKLQPKLAEQASLLEGLRRESTNKVVLLYSAGADSTATGLKLLENGYSIHPVFIDYGQTASKAEEFLANKGSEQFGFRNLHVIQMADLMFSLSQSSLLGGEAKDDAQAWVPARNTIFMLLAGVYAYQIDADGIAVGFMAEDQGVFGDSNIVHHKLTELLLTQSLSRPMQVFIPLMSLSKKEVLKYLVEKDALHLTVSCWNAKLEGEVVTSCHECANCKERDANLRKLAEEFKNELSETQLSNLTSAML